MIKKIIKNRLSILCLIVIISSLFILAACGQAPGAQTPSEAEIRIGDNASLTGMFSPFSIGATFGLRTAVDDINKEGGVYVKEYGRKLPVKLITVDNESDQTKASALTEDLILKDKVHYLTSDVASTTTSNPMSVVAERNHIPFINGAGPVTSFVAARMGVDPPWDYSWAIGFGVAIPVPEGDFRYGKPGYELFELWSDFLNVYGSQTNKKVGVFASADPDGTAWYRSFPSAVEKIGLEPVGVDKDFGLFPMETTDFSSYVTEWKKNNCEILVGNSPGNVFGNMWKQCYGLGYVPKICIAGRAAMFYEDASSWGGDLPLGVCSEHDWTYTVPAEYFPGIGGRTPQTLYEQWAKETGQPMNWCMGYGYAIGQVIFDAIERAGTLEPLPLNEATRTTDLETISGRVVFTPEEHFSRQPMSFGQWQKVNTPQGWEREIIFSNNEFIKPTAKPIFPIPTTTFK